MQYQNAEIIIRGAVNVRKLDLFCMEEKINEHMGFHLGGLITRDEAEDYEKKRLLGEVVKAYRQSESGDEELIGCGIITEAKISYKGGVCRIWVQGYSASYKMTAEKKLLCFQNPAWTYGDVIRKIARQGGVFFNSPAEERLRCPIIQYGETDWELLCRVAGQFRTVLIPDVTSGIGRVFFGHREQKTYYLNIDSRSRMSIQKDSKDKTKVCRSVKANDNMRIGDSVVLDKRKWTVVQKKTQYKNHMTDIWYVLGRIQDWTLPTVYNPLLCGAAIKGRVLERKEEYVRLWLEIDKEQKGEGFWYPYLPETGNIMYAMPEEGAESSVYFPDGREEHGIGINSFLEGAYLGRQRDHFVKGIHIPAWKEIKLHPDLTEWITNRNHRGSAVSEDGKEGIDLASGRPVRIEAGDGINMQSGLSCIATAGSRILVKQRGDKNKIEIFGNQILFHGEKYYTSSVMHKSRTSPEKTKPPGNGTFHGLYGSYVGLLAQGDAGPVNERLLAGMPVTSSGKGNTQIQDQAGLGIRRK